MSEHYQPNIKHSGSDNNHHKSSAVQRGNIKSNSHSQAQSQWKGKLRRGCLERAKLARKERLRKSRLKNCDNGGEPSLVDSCNDTCNANAQTNSRQWKRDRNESHPEWHDSELNDEGMVDHTPRDSSGNTCQTLLNGNLQHRESANSDENVVDTARNLVEQELQRALTGLQHCNQVCPVDGGIPWKKTNGGERGFRELDSMDSDLNELQGREETTQMEDEYKISQEEFANLLNDVTEELEREDELLEEEMWELERADAMERERLMHQVDDYESWEELEQQQQEQRHSQPNTYISPLANGTSPLVTCPICNSSSLMETPHDGITCTNAAAAVTNNCTFQLDIAHEGLTLNHLQNQLRTIYEEHSVVCSRGVLQFRVEERVGMSMLMAKCDVCSSDVVVL